MNVSSKDHEKNDSSESSYDEPVTLSSAELQKQLATAEEKANQHWERLLRQQAEMENLKERVKRDVANAHKYALGEFVLELLPIVDSLERASTTHSNEESGAGSLLDGVNLTLKMFYSSLEKFGVQQVDPIAQAFNPELHQAVSTQVDCDAKPGTVISVLQKGYLLNNRLVRPALVIVSK
jgi:molecular chaperone GrpE